MKTKILLFQFLFFIFLSYFAKAQIGISPPFLTIENLEKGEKRLYSFKVLTNENYTYVLIRSGEILYVKENLKKYLQNFSEENAVDWIKILENPIKIEKVGVIGEGIVNLIVNVPENSEPGYKLLFVRAFPIVQAQTGAPFGVVAIPAVEVPLIIHVKGDAIRNLKILDVKTNEKTLLIAIKNIGTVTSSFYLFINVTNEKQSKQIISNTNILKPNEQKVYYFDLKDLEKGFYNVSIKLDYFSNFEIFQSQIELKELKKIEVLKIEEVKDYSFLIIVLIVVIAIIVWLKRRE